MHCKICIAIILKTVCYICDNLVSTLSWVSRWTSYGNSPTVNTLGKCEYSRLECIIWSSSYSFCEHNGSWQIPVRFMLQFHVVQRVRICIAECSVPIWHCVTFGSVLQSKISRLPAYLTVQFVRFYYKEKESINAKILKDVKFPLDFDAFELCSPELQQKLTPMRTRFKVCYLAVGISEAVLEAESW